MSVFGKRTLSFVLAFGLEKFVYLSQLIFELGINFAVVGRAAAAPSETLRCASELQLVELREDTLTSF